MCLKQEGQIHHDLANVFSMVLEREINALCHSRVITLAVHFYQPEETIQVLVRSSTIKFSFETC